MPIGGSKASGTSLGGAACASVILAGLLVAAMLGIATNTAPAAEPGCPAAPHAHVLEATAPLNLGELKLQLIDYKCFGEYDRDVARVLMQAQALVQQRAKEQAKPALVLDIDETSLSNWRELIANDFGY